MMGKADVEGVAHSDVFIAPTHREWCVGAMKFGDLLTLVGDLPAFETSLLLAGECSSAETRRQLSRWASAGKIIQLRKGLYALAPPFAQNKPHPFVIANALVRGSYVSVQSALAHYGMILNLRRRR